MTTRTPTPSGPRHPVPNPYAKTWTEAASTLTALMSKIDSVIEDIGTASKGLHWQGGSERYFQWQVGRRVHYLGQNNSYLETLRTLVTNAQEAGSAVAPPQGGGAA